jgi:excisionase family DNA binding protein
MAKGKNVLTTGDVARICNVAPRTVSKWFDSGQLRGYRIPGSKDRRIPLTELLRFMKQHNIPTSELTLVGTTRILIVDNSASRAASLAEKLKAQNHYDVQTVSSEIETGITASKFSPHVLLINVLAKDIDGTAISRTIKASEDLQTIKVIALCNKYTEAEANALLRKGFDGFVRSDDVSEVIRKIEDVIAIVY